MSTGVRIPVPPRPYLNGVPVGRPSGRERDHERAARTLRGYGHRQAGIKLSTVASDIMGVSGRAMPEALIPGEHDPQTLAEMAKRKLRNKIPVR